MSSKIRVELKSTDDLLRLSRGPLEPNDRKAVEDEIARRAPSTKAEPKDQMGLFEK